MMPFERIDIKKVISEKMANDAEFKTAWENSIKKCVNGKELQVLNSPAGFYIGTLSNDNGFVEHHCRISEYYKTRREAMQHLDAMDFTYRHCVENEYCSEGYYCF